MAPTASAAVATFNTSAPGTGFGAGGIGGLTLNSSSGGAATFLFTPNAGNTSGVPTNVNLGNFVLACATCSIQSRGVYARFAPFAFDIVVTDLTAGGATGTFTGTSTGGDVYRGVSLININWSAPRQSAWVRSAARNCPASRFADLGFGMTLRRRLTAPRHVTVGGHFFGAHSDASGHDSGSQPNRLNKTR
jgi:hypothetical protein